MLRRSVATLAVAATRSSRLLIQAATTRNGAGEAAKSLLLPSTSAADLDLLNLRSFASFSSSTTTTTEDSLDARLDAVNRLFSAAREDLEDAQEDEGTVHFEESYNAAYKSVEETLQEFDAVLASLEEEKRGSVRRSMGLKMEQLKAELGALEPH